MPSKAPRKPIAATAVGPVDTHAANPAVAVGIEVADQRVGGQRNVLALDRGKQCREQFGAETRGRGVHVHAAVARIAEIENAR